LRRAFEWFDSKVKERCLAARDPGRELAEFLEKAADRLFFTVVTVEDELNAYRVFETLNARGVRLSATDLLKNWLFSLLDRGGSSQHELADLADRWEALVGRLGAENFSEYLRVQWNSRHPATREGSLFKTIRNAVRDRGAVFQLLREMEEDLDHFLALKSPEVSHWDPELRGGAQRLKLFAVTRQVPLLIAARRRFDDEEFGNILRACVVISLRYNVICGYSTGEQERAYNDVALRIARNQLGSADAVVDALRAMYPTDATFRAAFAEKSLRTTSSGNAKIVRFLLCSIERHHAGAAELDEASDSFGVEHVLPQNPGPEWVEFDPADVESFAYRLGNMTLLESKANHRVGNAGWPSKRNVLAASGFAISRKIGSDTAEWSPERIAQHQLWLAKQATAIWRVGRLS